MHTISLSIHEIYSVRDDKWLGVWLNDFHKQNMNKLSPLQEVLKQNPYLSILVKNLNIVAQCVLTNYNSLCQLSGAFQEKYERLKL